MFHKGHIQKPCRSVNPRMARCHASLHDFSRIIRQWLNNVVTGVQVKYICMCCVGFPQKSRTFHSLNL